MDLFKLVGTIVINNTEANESIDNTTKKAEDLGTAIENAGTSADNASSKLNESGKFHTASVWLGNTLYKLTEKAVELGTNLGKIGFGFNMGIESYQYQFKALLQDEEKAKQLVADIQELAKVSPLGLEGLAGNAVSLLQTGTELTEIIPTLEMLGNLALGDPQHMDSIVRAFTQIISKGGLMAQEMYQLGDAMVPIRDIMTQYGGERYADGSWYELKMTDPTFKIPAEDMIKAFHAATAEGGQWHDYMYTYMESFAGQWDRLGEEGKESLGAFFEPFFEMAKSDVLPNLTASLESFRTWATDNRDTLEKMAEAIGKFATISFDALLECFKWMTEHGEEMTAILGGLATALLVSAIAAHPYAAAIMAAVAGLIWLREEAKKSQEEYQSFIDTTNQSAPYRLAGKYAGWTDDQKTAGQNYISDYLGGYDTSGAVLEMQEVGLSPEAISSFRADMSEALNSSDFKIELSDLWFEETAEESLQTQLDGMTLESETEINAAPNTASMLQSYLNSIDLSAYAQIIPSMSSLGVKMPTFVNGSHASGLDYVPHDGYIAELHKGETVLNRTSAEAWRNGGGTSGIEAKLDQLISIMSGGQQVVLDTGILCGQIATKMDAQLGTISNRKGRRN